MCRVRFFSGFHFDPFTQLWSHRGFKSQSFHHFHRTNCSNGTFLLCSLNSPQSSFLPVDFQLINLMTFLWLLQEANQTTHSSSDLSAIVSSQCSMLIALPWNFHKRIVLFQHKFSPFFAHQLCTFLIFIKLKQKKIVLDEKFFERIKLPTI